MSQATNAVGAQRRYWGVIPVMPAQQLMETAKLMEDPGYLRHPRIQTHRTFTRYRRRGTPYHRRRPPGPGTLRG